jgi:DNA-binding CsgD family transcriptional regulator
VRLFVAISDEKPKVRLFAFVRKHLVLVALVTAAFIWLYIMSAMVHSNIINAGIDGSILILLLGIVLSPAAFFVYGFITDKDLPQFAFIGGLCIALLGPLLFFISGQSDTALFLPLVLADGIGGAYISFFLLALPVFYTIGTKRPVFAAASGMIASLLASSPLWVAEKWLPEQLRVLDANLLLSLSISVLVFMVLAHFIIQLYQVKELAVDLYRSFYSEDIKQAPPCPGELIASNPVTRLPYIPESMENAGLLSEERAVTSLLIEGFTKGEIARKLHMSAATVSEHMRTIREKIGAFHSDVDQLLERVAAEYKLTGREAQILRELYEGKTNSRIASDLFISSETVKFHVKNIMTKLPLEGRAELREWLIGRH